MVAQQSNLYIKEVIKMVTATVKMAEMSWDEYENRINDDAVVLFAVGAVEQHGYHMPLGTDFLLGNYIATRVAEEINGVVAPPVSYGARSQPRTGGGPHRMGGVNLRPETLMNLVYDILLEFARHGAKKVAVIDAHYENRFFLDEACYRAQQDIEAKGNKDFRIVKILYPEYIKPETIQKVYEGKYYPGLDLEHAGILETSMMLYAFPDLINMDKAADEPPAEFPHYDVFPVKPEWVPASGCLSCGKEGNREAGELLVEEFVVNASSILKKEYLSEKS